MIAIQPTAHQTGEKRMNDGLREGASPTPRTPVLDLLIILRQQRRRVFVCTILGLLLGAIPAYMTDAVYTATAAILPPQAPQSTLTSLMGQLGPLSALGGGGGLLKNSSDLYIGILQSRTVTDKVIDAFHLDKEWKTIKRDDARNHLLAIAQFEAAKNGLIIIQVKDKSPQHASDIANFYVDALYGMNSNLAITEASQRRLFFDQQLNEEKNALAAAEEDLKRTQQKTGLLSLTGQAEQAVRNVAQTRAQIASRQVELQSLKIYATEQNPDVVRLERDIATLQAQLTGLENSQQQAVPGDTEISANQVPVGGLEYTRRLREVKYHDTLLDLLSRQFEAARIDEAKSAPIIQVVDRAVPPDKKSGPHRTLILLIGGLAGFCVACLWSFWRAALVHARYRPHLAGKLSQLGIH